MRLMKDTMILARMKLHGHLLMQSFIVEQFILQLVRIRNINILYCLTKLARADQKNIFQG